MNLVTGRLLWADSLPNPPRYPSLSEDIRCDVLVIGGGQTGAMCGYYLSKQGIDTVVIEKDAIGTGSTLANTGMVQFANDKPLAGCINTFGEASGVRFYTLCRQAVYELERLSSGLDIDPGYKRRSSLYTAATEQDVPALQQEFALLQKYGFPVDYWGTEEIGRRFSFRKPGAIYSPGNAEINPYKLTCGLISAASKQGLRVFENTEIQSNATVDGQLIFYTKDRKKITAGYAVVATGYGAQKLKRNRNAVLKSSFAVATAPIEPFTGWYERCLLWETARPYLYIRTTPDNRIIAGGMDESSPESEQRKSKLPHKREQLLAEIARLFPQAGPLQADYFWAGVFADTHDGYPMFGPQDGFPSRCLFALPYGGNGSVYSVIGAQIVTSLIVNGSHPDEHLFRFDRPNSKKA